MNEKQAKHEDFFRIEHLLTFSVLEISTQTQNILFVKIRELSIILRENYPKTNLNRSVTTFYRGMVGFLANILSCCATALLSKIA